MINRVVLVGRLTKDSEWRIGRVFYCSMQPAFQTGGTARSGFYQHRRLEQDRKQCRKVYAQGLSGRCRGPYPNAKL